MIAMGCLSLHAQSMPYERMLLDSGDVAVHWDIVFGYSSDELQPSSRLELDSLAQYLLGRPELVVEVGVHSDERMKDRYSICWTCRRARAIVNYLISKGISSDRLLARGYNDQFPLIKGAKTEEEHQKNRRTEFKVIRIQRT